MIIADSSALVAILLEEPDSRIFLRACARADRIMIGTPNVLETQMVMIGRHGEPGRPLLGALLRDLEAEVQPFLPEHAELAADAFARFGKGSHRAKLNFGDCMAYALAKSLGAPLLFKGDDFIHTDIESAL